MSYGVIVNENDRPVGEVRICYVRAWDDWQWCQQNGLPSPKERRAAQLAAKREARTASGRGRAR